MKKLFYLIIVFAYISCSDDNQVEGVFQLDEMNVENDLKIEEAFKIILYQKSILDEFLPNINRSTRSRSYGDKLSFISVSSSDIYGSTIWGFRIPNTNTFLYIEDPKDVSENGVSLINGEMILSLEIQNPKCFIVDFNDGLVKYSNWCDVKNKGNFKMNGKVEHSYYDLDGDGINVIHTYNFVPVDSDFLHLEVTMNDSQNSNPYIYPLTGDCQTSNEEAKLMISSQLENGILETKITMN